MRTRCLGASAHNQVQYGALPGLTAAHFMEHNGNGRSSLPRAKGIILHTNIRTTQTYMGNESFRIPKSEEEYLQTREKKNRHSRRMRTMRTNRSGEKKNVQSN